MIFYRPWRQYWQRSWIRPKVWWLLFSGCYFFVPASCWFFSNCGGAWSRSGSWYRCRFCRRRAWRFLSICCRIADGLRTLAFILCSTSSAYWFMGPGGYAILIQKLLPFSALFSTAGIDSVFRRHFFTDFCPILGAVPLDQNRDRSIFLSIGLCLRNQSNFSYSNS